MNAYRTLMFLLTAFAVTGAYAGGKTLAEWLREADMAYERLNAKDDASAAKAVEGAAFAQSAAAQKGEVEALKQYQIGIDLACAEVRTMASFLKAEGYSSDSEGFEPLMKKVGVAIKYVATPPKPTSTLEVSRVMSRVDMAAFILSSAISYLRENRAARDEAREIRNDIDRRLVPYLLKCQVPASAKSEYERGMAALKLGRVQFEKGEFALATESFSKSKQDLASVRSRMIVLHDAPTPVR